MSTYWPPWPSIAHELSHTHPRGRSYDSSRGKVRKVPSRAQLSDFARTKVVISLSSLARSVCLCYRSGPSDIDGTLIKPRGRYQVGRARQTVESLTEQV